MDYPSLSEIGSALNTVFNPFGPTIDPATMAQAGGPNKPREDDLVRQFIGKDRSPIAQQYEDFTKQHPVVGFLAEQGLSAALNELPYGKALRGLGLGNVADILDLTHDVLHGPPGGFGGGANIKDPKLKWGEIQELQKPDPEREIGGVYRIPIQDRKTDQEYGKMKFLTDPEGKHGEVGWLDADLPKDVRTGHLLHIKDELADSFPELEDVNFIRIPNAKRPDRLANEAPPTSVTLPIRRKGVESDPEMFSKAIEGERQSRMKRERIYLPEQNPDEAPPIMVPNFSHRSEAGDHYMVSVHPNGGEGDPHVMDLVHNADTNTLHVTLPRESFNIGDDQFSTGVRNMRDDFFPEAHNVQLQPGPWADELE